MGDRAKERCARFDIAAKTIQDKYVPMSNLPNNFFEVRAPDPIDTNEGTLKIDHQISQSQSVAFSYFHQRGVDTQPLTGTGNIPWVDRDFAWKQHNVNLAHTWTMGPSMFNQLRGTYVRQFGARVNNPVTSLADLNSKFTPQGDPTLPRLTVSGYFTGQTSIAGPDAGSNYTSVKDALTITKGKHSVKIGGDVSYEAIIHDTLLDNYGVFTFNGSKTGNAYADFLLGLPATMTQDAPVRKTDNGAYFSAFAQDDFRVHSRVTLNLGVRYDLQMPYTDPQDRKLAYVPGQKSTVNPTAPVGLLFPGDAGVSRGIVHTDKNNIAPRLGVAWDPNGDGRTAVRASFGMFYGSITGNEWNTTADNQPFTVRQSFPTVFTLAGLTLPDAAVKRDDYSYEQRLSVALLYLVSQFARRLLNGMDRRLPKAIILDEAWAITSTPQGAKLIPEVSRMGRSRNTALILVSQNAGDLLNEQVTNCLSGVFAFRSTERGEVANVMSLLGVAPSDEHKAVLRSLGNGECIFRDLDDRAGRIGVDLVSSELQEWIDTNPTRVKRSQADPFARREPSADEPSATGSRVAEASS
jgi:hypothetical protein